MYPVYTDISKRFAGADRLNARRTLSYYEPEIVWYKVVPTQGKTVLWLE